MSKAPPPPQKPTTGVVASEAEKAAAAAAAHIDAIIATMAAMEAATKDPVVRLKNHILLLMLAHEVGKWEVRSEHSPTICAGDSEEINKLFNTLIVQKKYPF